MTERPATDRTERGTEIVNDSGPTDPLLDRRRLLRGAGAVLLTSAIAGCFDEGGDGGEDEEDGGGAYDVGRPPAAGE